MGEVVTTRDRDRASPSGPDAAPLRPELRQPLHVPGSQPPVSLGTMVITAAGVIAALYFGRDVFIPLALAVLLGFALSPIVSLLRHAGLPRALAVLIVVVIALALAAGFAWLLFNQAAGLAQDLPKYEYNLRQKVRLIRADTAGSAHPGRGGIRRPRTAGAAAGADPVSRAGGRRPRSRGLSVSVACPPWPGR